MHPFKVVLLVATVAAIFGIAAAFFARRLPASGYTALGLLCCPIVSLLIFQFDFPYDNALRVVGQMLFFGTIPFCVVYAIHARRRSPQKRAALVALTGSVFLALPYLIMTPQMLYQLFLEISGSGLTK